MDQKNVLTLLCYLEESHKHLMIFFSSSTLGINHFTVVTTNSSNLGGGRQSTVTMVFTHWPREDCFPVSRALGGKCRCLKPFLQYFATGSDTASCQDYEEYEFVECMSEETRIIDLFKH